MAKLLTAQEKQNLQEAVEDAGYKWDLDVRLYPVYSGRFMYGETCFGLVVDNPTIVPYVLGRMITMNEELSTSLMNAYHTDALGLDSIVYFPGYLWTERTQYADVDGTDF